MKNENFFEVQKEQSQIKALIVKKYFLAWAKIIAGYLSKDLSQPQKLYYVDLYAGQGKYDDGNESTPLLVLRDAISNDKIRNMLYTIFNDEDKDIITKLEQEVGILDGISQLRNKPIFLNKPVQDISLNTLFPSKKIPPTLLFIDPFGYKGLTLDLFGILRSWACEVIFFFNYRRINAALNNSSGKEHMIKLFGKEISDNLENELPLLNVSQREELILKKIEEAIKRLQPDILPPLIFKFKNAKGTAINHHLIFITKNSNGYELMKEVMAKESSEKIDGVGLFAFDQNVIAQPKLIECLVPMEELMDELLIIFKGKTMKMEDIYHHHNIGTPYIKKNYKEALRRLENNNKISINPPSDKRRVARNSLTLSDTAIITFP